MKSSNISNASLYRAKDISPNPEVRALITKAIEHNITVKEWSLGCPGSSLTAVNGIIYQPHVRQSTIRKWSSALDAAIAAKKPPMQLPLPPSVEDNSVANIVSFDLSTPTGIAALFHCAGRALIALSEEASPSEALC